MKKRTLKEGQEVFVINQVTAGANYFGKVRMPQGEKTFDDKTKEEMVHVIITEFIDEDARELSGLKVGDIITSPVRAVYSVVPNKFCQGYMGERCKVCEEHFTDIEYPYYAPIRDENMYECEVMTIDPNTQVPRKVQEKKGYVLNFYDLTSHGWTCSVTLYASENKSLIVDKMNEVAEKFADTNKATIIERNDDKTLISDGDKINVKYCIEETTILA